MISAFVSREFGFGMHLSEEDFLKVNRFRSTAGNKYYKDAEAATSKLGSAVKPQLSETPFVKEFEYGASESALGYWCYEWMILQLEDCIDVVQALYPEYDFAFMFDHSCGHDRKRPDGLSANNLNKGFGGAQPKMRNTVISDEDQLGPFLPTLTIGQTQRLVFEETDDGPSWLTREEQLLWKFDRPCPKGSTIRYRYTKAELAARLLASDLPTWGTKKELEQRCITNGIPTTEQRPKVLEGWNGKAKGAFQILFERGFIQVGEGGIAQAYKMHTMEGSKNLLGEQILGSSLKELIVVLPDFVEEKTLLQYHAEGRSINGGPQIVLLRSPKCHPEVAGEGIEYDWAASKSWYRRLPISDKNTKEKFRENVRRSLQQITKTYRRSFGKRAREYILAYDALARWNEIHGINETEPETSARLLDKVVDHRRSHRSVSHDTGWLNQLVAALKSTNSAQ
jgi:hypothetical protein